MYYEILAIIAIVILLSMFSSKLLYKLGVPTLIIFIVLGMIFGSGGIGKIYFDDYHVMEMVASIGLLIIIFYGGFETRWDIAKAVALPAILMSSLGTVVTAFVTGIFAMFILDVPFLYGLLFGSVIASTDAASVFSILHSKNMNLKSGLSSLLEIESGSNDPFAYLMTVIVVTLITNSSKGVTFSFFSAIATQLIYGIAIAIVLALISVYILKRVDLESEAFYSILLLSIAILGFSLCGFVGGNGFLCAYIIGIIIGNSKILHKVALAHFFDAFSWLMQLMLFFFVGLLVDPEKIVEVFVPGTLISLVMMFISRPVATFLVLFKTRISRKKKLFISWVGLRGAASITFAIIAVMMYSSKTGGEALPYDMFHLVFYVAFFSVAVQGTLIPYVAKKLGHINEEKNNSVMKTFHDYHEETHAELMEYTLYQGHLWIDRMLVNVNIPDEILIVMIKRRGEIIIPRGATIFEEGDVLVFSGDDFGFIDNIGVDEKKKEELAEKDLEDDDFFVDYY